MSFLADSFEPGKIESIQSLEIVLDSIRELWNFQEGVCGKFCDHCRLGSLASVAHALEHRDAPLMTPFAAHCIGNAVARQLVQSKPDANIVIGRDTRPSGASLAEAFGRGAESAGCSVVHVGVTKSGSLHIDHCDAVVLVTGKSLPRDWNGFCVDSKAIELDKDLIRSQALECAKSWCSKGVLPPSNTLNEEDTVIQNTLQRTVEEGSVDDALLKDLKVVLNARNGLGDFLFDVLVALGADLVYLKPSREAVSLEQETVTACRRLRASAGIATLSPRECVLVLPEAMGDGYEVIDGDHLEILRSVLLLESKQDGSYGVSLKNGISRDGVVDILARLQLD